jgi:dephospho-CoA kinase
MKRDNITEEYAIKKINAQMDIEEKKKRADFVIDNRKGLDRTFRQLDTVLRRLI